MIKEMLEKRIFTARTDLIVFLMNWTPNEKTLVEDQKKIEDLSKKLSGACTTFIGWQKIPQEQIKNIEAVHPEWLGAMWHFGETGDFIDAFDTHLESCKTCQDAVEALFQIQLQGLKEFGRKLRKDRAQAART